MRNGDATMAMCWTNDAAQLHRDIPDMKYVLGKDGGEIWVDHYAVVKGAPNREAAYAFIDYILHPQVNADISNFTAYATPVQAAIDAELILPEYLTNAAVYPSPEVVATAFTNLALPDVEQVYGDAWDEVKILLGR